MTKAIVTKAEVERMAQLARLKLSDAEIAAAADDLSNILDHFAAIQAIDTTDTPTADDISGLTGVTRPDEAKPQELAEHEQLLAAAPERKGDHVKVKAVFKD